MKRVSYFFLKKRKRLLKRKKRKVGKKKLYRVYSFIPRRRLSKKKNLSLRRVRSHTQTFIYFQPFFITKMFLSRMLSAKLLKRLANIW